MLCLSNSWREPFYESDRLEFVIAVERHGFPISKAAKGSCLWPSQFEVKVIGTLEKKIPGLSF